MTVDLRPATSMIPGELWGVSRSDMDGVDLFCRAGAICWCGKMIDPGRVAMATCKNRVDAFWVQNGPDVEAFHAASASVRQGHGALLLADAQERCIESAGQPPQQKRAAVLSPRRSVEVAEETGDATSDYITMYWQHEALE